MRRGNEIPGEVQELVEIPSACRRPSGWGRCVRLPAASGGCWLCPSRCWWHVDDLDDREHCHWDAALHESTGARGTLLRATSHSPRRPFYRLRPLNSCHHDLSSTSTHQLSYSLLKDFIVVTAMAKIPVNIESKYRNSLNRAYKLGLEYYPGLEYKPGIWLDCTCTNRSWGLLKDLR